MLLIAGFLAAVLAPLAVIAAISISRYAPQPPSRLRWTVTLCAVTTFVASIASAIVVNKISAVGDGDIVARAGSTWRVLPILALFEELSRFVVLAGYAMRARFATSTRDGIMLGLAAGLAFALLENIMTSVGPGAGSSASGWIRLLMATPLHALLGGLMGYLLVRAAARTANKAWGMGEAILLPTAVHILYDAPVIFAIVHWGTALTVEAFTAVVAMSAAVEVALAWFVWRLFRRG